MEENHHLEIGIRIIKPCDYGTSDLQTLEFKDPGFTDPGIYGPWIVDLQSTCHLICVQYVDVKDLKPQVSSCLLTINNIRFNY